MAVALRLKREGTKDRPFYRVVATDSRAPRDGRPIESLGTYDPMNNSATTLDLEKVDKWLGNGAKASETVTSLIKKCRKAAAES